jgi:hypothetical protein
MACEQGTFFFPSSIIQPSRQLLTDMANVIGVVVTLTPVYSPDTLPFRSLTFLSNNDTVPVGRASKSETKNLVPNHDNGWFDSRVMSREHAVIGVKMEDKVSLLRLFIVINHY